MNDDQIDDLKQYIAVTISQVTADMATKSDIGVLKGDIGTLKGDIGTLKGDIGTLKGDIGVLKGYIGLLKSDLVDLRTHVDSRLNELQASIADSLSVTNDSVEEQIVAHDVRLTRLEKLATR